MVSVVVGNCERLLECGVTEILRRDRGVELLASDLAGEELEAVVAREAPKVLIVDEEIEYTLLASLRTRRPALGIIVLAHEPSPLFATLVLAAGAMCLALSASEAELVAAVHSAADGVARNVIAPGRRVEDIDSAVGPLTAREAQVFMYLSLGWSYAEMGDTLHISPTTVRTHTLSICRKLNVGTKRQLIGRGWPPTAQPPGFSGQR